MDHHDPATYRGGVLQLHYARAQKPELWLDCVAVHDEVVVQL